MKKFYLLLAFCLGLYANAQIVNIPDANFKAKLLLASPTQSIAYNAAGTKIKIDVNNDSEIQVSEAQQVFRLAVPTSSIADLTGIQSFTNLTRLECNNNQLTSLIINTLTNLTYLNCSFNQLTNLDVTATTGLITFDCSDNLLSSLNVASLSVMTTLDCYNNQLNTIDVSTNVALIGLDCSKNLLTTLNVSNLINLQKLFCSRNSLTSLNLLNQNNLIELYCWSNTISTLLLNESNSNLNVLQIGSNNLTSFNFNAFPSIEELSCGGNPYTSNINIDNLIGNLVMLDLSNSPLNLLPINNSNAPNFIKLELLFLENIDFEGQLSNFDFSLFPILNSIYFRNSTVNQININSSTIYRLAVSGTDITTLDLSNLPILEQVEANNTQLNSIIFNYNAPLVLLFLGSSVSNPTPPTITNLDLSAFNSLASLSVLGWNQLTTLNIKNGYNGSVSFNNCPNLQYICADEGEITSIQNNITTYGYTNCHVNTYCTFEPGGTFYTIQGNHRFDLTNNGCDTNDYLFSNMKFNITSGTNTTTLISGNDGTFHYDVPAGSYTITAVPENPSYYTISPATSNVTFPTSASPFTQNFCFSSSAGADLQVTILSLTAARPGFNNKYKLIYKNVGGIPLNGTVNFTFNDAINDLVQSIPSFSTQSVNNLSWNFSNLLPFESREILLTLNLNSPTDNPAVNAGDIQPFTASVSSSFTDLTPSNNTFLINQSIVNSYDPNDKTCLEGTTITPDKVGEYVHYIIRFENTGTANAQNVVVKDVIDTTKYDIATLIPLDGSHEFYTRITNTNQVEFIFENILLPFDDDNNDGYVAFKIKTKSNLTVGSSFSNTANIYFDYNFPIVTNTATTTIQALGNSDFEFNDYFTLSPVPTKDVLHFEANQGIEVSSINIYNTLGQLILVETNPSNQINVSNLKAGNYFIKVISDKGTSVGKFVKQ